MYTLVSFGLAGIMIFFIATIVAGILLGAFIAVASLVHSLRPSEDVTKLGAAPTTAEPTVARGAL